MQVWFSHMGDTTKLVNFAWLHLLPKSHKWHSYFINFFSSICWNSSFHREFPYICKCCKTVSLSSPVGDLCVYSKCKLWDLENSIHYYPNCDQCLTLAVISQLASGSVWSYIGAPWFWHEHFFKEVDSFYWKWYADAIIYGSRIVIIILLLVSGVRGGSS